MRLLSAAASRNHCLNMRFYGSAMPDAAHSRVRSRQRLIAEAWQAQGCRRVIDQRGSPCRAFRVTLHARRGSGSLLGKSVLVTGCGPIGALAIIAARVMAREIVATDVLDGVLEKARSIGADRGNQRRHQSRSTRKLRGEQGTLTSSFEASGNAHAVRSGLDVFEAPIGACAARSRRMSPSRKTWWWQRRSRYAARSGSMRSSVSQVDLINAGRVI